MRSPIQEAGSLCEYHWLFSDELPEESLPLFFPRVLNFGQSPTPSSQGTPFQPRPMFRREQSYGEQSSPVYDPKNCPPYYSIEDESAPRHSSDSIASPGYLHPLEDLPLGASQGLKRQIETSHEDDDHTRKYLRLSETRPSNIIESIASDASVDFTPSRTASPSFQFSGPLSGPSYSSFDHLLEAQSLRAQLAVSESRNAQCMVDLADSRVCIDFLLNELRRVIASGASDRPMPEKVQRIIRNTQSRVPRVSPDISHPTASLSPRHAPSPTLPETIWNEDFDPRNPYSYYFSEQSMVGPSTQLGPGPASLPTSSQMAPASFHSFGSFPPIGQGRSSNGFTEMSRVASEEFTGQSSYSLAQPRRNPQPDRSHLVPDPSHARLESYLSLYYTAPRPMDTFEENRGNLGTRNYELPAHM